MIEALALRKSFGKVQAVQEVSFSAPNGKITGILGPNGAGKSTVLRMLCTLVRPDSGVARVDGLDAATQGAQVRARMGVLPDGPGLYQRLTARENIRYFGELQGMGGKDLELRVEELLQLLELSAVADRRAGNFSQGERMKTALARALVHRPANLLLDEPTNGLDVHSTRILRDFLRRQRAEGHCIIFSSHVMTEVAALADEIVVIAQGRVVAEGTAEALRERTGASSLEDAFVALTGATP